MDDLVTGFNVVASATLCALLAAAVLSDRVKDGIVIKAGLSLMALGLALTTLVLMDGLAPSDVWRLNNSRAVMLLGGLLAAFGLAWRMWRGERRSADYIERRIRA